MAAKKHAPAKPAHKAGHTTKSRCKASTTHGGRAHQCGRDDGHHGDHEASLVGGKRVSWPPRKR